MHALVITVNIGSGQFEAARASLQGEVVPRVSKAPGFVKGYWTKDTNGQRGLSMVLFKTKQDADQALNMVRSSPMAPGVTIDTAEVREVIAEA